MPDIFGKNFRKYDAWYDRNKFAYLSELKALKKTLPKKGKGLEIGVGTGRFAAPLFLAKYIEKAGSGTVDMVNRCQKAGIRKPEFKIDGGFFILRIWRKRAKGGQPESSTSPVPVAGRSYSGLVKSWYAIRFFYIQAIKPKTSIRSA